MFNKQDETKGKNQSNIFDFASTFASTGLIQVIGVITGVLTARLLGPAGKGDLATVFWLPGLVTAAGILALPQAVAFQVSRYPENDKALTAAGFWLSLFWGMIAVAILYPLIPYILGANKQHLVDISRWFLLYLPLAFCGLTLLGIDQGRQTFTRYNLFRLLPTFFFITGILFLWLMGRANITTIVLSNLIAQLVATWIRASVAGKELFPHSLSLWLTTAKQVLKSGVVFHLPALASIILLRADMALLIHMVSAEEIGYYSVAMAVSMGQLGVATSIVQVGFPKVAAHKSNEALEMLLRQFRLAQPVVFSVALVVALSSPWIIRYLFGSAFMPAVLPTLILIMAIALWGLNQILDNGLRAAGFGIYGAIANGAGLVILLPSGFVLTKLYSITGMAMSSFLAQIIVLVALILFCHEKLFAEWGSLWGVNKRTVYSLLNKLWSIPYVK